MTSPLLEQVSDLPVEQVIDIRPDGEIHSKQWLSVPRTSLPGDLCFHPALLVRIGSFYFRRLAQFSKGILGVQLHDKEHLLTLRPLALPLFIFTPKSVDASAVSGEARYEITGGVMLARHAPKCGVLRMGVNLTSNQLRLYMVVQHYYSPISGTGEASRLRSLLYKYTQARLHHRIAEDYLRNLATVMISGRL